MKKSVKVQLLAPCNLIVNFHTSPFMTRPKANSNKRRVIMDMSWPKGYSVNARVDKNMYMGSEFKLMFSTIDDLMSLLVRGAHIYKIVSHLPIDYDLLGLQWNDAYIDIRLLSGARPFSQFFQRTSDAIRFPVINIDDFLQYGTPVSAQHSFDALYDTMRQIGLTISENKLVSPCTREGGGAIGPTLFSAP